MGRAARLAALALTLAAPTGCARRKKATEHAAATSSLPLVDAGGADDAGDMLPPLAGHSWLEDVEAEAPSGSPGKLSVPLGATSKRPSMLGLHGAGDRAEWSCGEWRGVTDAFSFVFCPHGNASHIYWDSPQATRAQIAQAESYLERVFANYLCEGCATPELIAGFSAGTTMAIGLVRAGLVEPQALVLVEGSYPWVADEGFALTLRKHHVRRLLLVCTTRGLCPKTYTEALPRVARQGIDARVNLASDRGHGIYPEVVSALKRDWLWLVRDLHGWESYPGTWSP
jgi:hypothetical protein